MEQPTSYIIPTIKIVDEDFNLVLAEAHELSILIGTQQISFAVIDPMSYRLHWLETFNFDENLKPEQLLSHLALLFSQNNALKNMFWKTIKIGFVHQKSTLVPESLFDEAYLVNYFQLNCVFHPDTEQILTHKHKNAAIINLFAVDTLLLDFLKAHYSSKKIAFLHLGSAMIEGLLHDENSSAIPTIFINLNPEIASFAVKNGNNLAYFNSFHVKDFKDLLYYTLFIAEEFGFSQENLKVAVWGNTGLEQSYVLALREYIQVVELGDKPKGLSASYMFSDIPKHQYFDLLSITLCT
ncbi:MAG: hypothetical protein RL711_1262 [Bacteroidota bacterium]